jgi:hypothetical protein
VLTEPRNVAFDDLREPLCVLRRQAEFGDGFLEWMAVAHHTAHQFADGVAVYRAKQVRQARRGRLAERRGDIRLGDRMMPGVPLFGQVRITWRGAVG